MELRIFNSILYGQLRPWLEKNRKEKFYGNRLTPQFIKPRDNINDYFEGLKSIVGSNNELVNSNPLDLYLAQTKTDIDADINNPLIEIVGSSLEPNSQTEWFYFSLIKNESTRTISNIFQALCRAIKEIDRSYIVNSYKNSIIELLKNTQSVSENLSEDDSISKRVILTLKENAIRMLTELQLLCENYFNTILANKYQIYQEYLKETPPPEDYYQVLDSQKIIQLQRHITEAKTGFKLQPVINPNAISFGFNGDKDKLKSVLSRLNVSVDLLKDTSADYLYEVFVADDIDTNGDKIYLGLNTNEFRYIIDQIKPKFKNLKLSTIEKIGLFRSKDNPQNPLKARTLSSSKPTTDTQNKATIDSILKDL